MLGIRKISPMARAIGTMGVVATLVGAVTFAAVTSNTVALTDNNLTSGTPMLQIGTAVDPFGNSATGLTATLKPNIPKSFTFFLQNNDTSPLTITASIPSSFAGSQIPPSAVTMALDCGSGSVSFPISSWAGGSAPIPGTVAANGGIATCTETVTLDASYSPSGNTLNSYTINFVGNE